MSVAAFTRRRWWRCDPWSWGARGAGYQRVQDWIFYFGPGHWR